MRRVPCSALSAGGIERRKIFRDKPDRDRFLQRLDAVLTESGTPCYAWILIPNHLCLVD